MAKEGGDVSHSPRFFSVLLPGFSKKLRIPREFVKHIIKEKCSTRATLVNPNGKSWNVNVYKTTYLGGAGWLQLVHAHNLGLGYFVVFRYRGNMIFSFRAYDLSACEITYPFIPQKGENKKQRQDEEEEDDKPRLRKSYKGKGACFEATISAYNLLNNYMYIPMGFRATSGLWKQTELTLRDPKGRSWPVLLSCTQYPGKRPPQCYIAKGWRQFARGNQLKKGDRCIFELVSKENEKTIRVQILKCLNNDLVDFGTAGSPAKKRKTTADGGHSPALVMVPEASDKQGDPVTVVIDD